MVIVNRIKQLRVASGFTQTELADKVGLTFGLVDMKLAKSSPSSVFLQRLAGGFDTTSDFLMVGSQDDLVSARLTDKELLKQLSCLVQKIKT